MEEGLIKEREEIRRKFEVEFRRILLQRRLKFESEIIQGYEHDFSVLKYQKEQLEKGFSLEMQTLKLKLDQEKLEIENRFKNEKKDLKRVLKWQYERKLSGDKLRLKWLLNKFQLGRRASTDQLDSNDSALSTSSIYSD